MDRITQSLLGEFSAEAGIDKLPDSKRFEHFSVFLTVNQHFAETFNTDDVVTGSGADTGIDGLAIILNGILVTDAEEVDEVVEINGYADAIFIFIQAETSSSFNSKKIGDFGFGVVDFFSEAPKLPRNNYIENFADVMAAVYNHSSKFLRGNPSCRLYYVTTGKWTEDANLEARRQAVVEDLERLNIFREVELLPVGSDVIQKWFTQTKNAIAREFTFSSRTVAPDIAGVSESYLGILPAAEFVSLLDDGNGNIMKSIFYDNIRDWQEYNQVNDEIRTTLESNIQKSRFVLMNNGITIIAKKLRATGNKFHIEDYQIVNGCQTSHVLFDNQQYLDENVVVPLRLIATTDDEVTASIIKATNRQTQVKEEQLIAYSDFQKKLETYFQTFPTNRRLYFERRSRQYNTVANIEKTRIVTPPNLIRAFASIILEEPHRTTRNYRALVDQLGKSIFVPDDRLEPYYLAASMLYRLEFLFRNGVLESKYKAARYHLLFAARLILSNDDPPRTNSHEMARYCEPLIEVFWKADKGESTFAKAARVVDVVAQDNFHRDNIRTQTFTEEIRRCLRN